MSFAITRPPGASLAACELTHLPRVALDVERARAEHAAYRDALAALGREVVTLAPLPEHPDGVFVEDVAIVLDEVAILPRMGAASRRDEAASVARALAPHREIVRMSERGTMDGGDVLAIEELLYVGQSTRTDHPALKELAHTVLEHGLAVKAVEVRGCLHLKTACTYLGEGRLLANRRWLHTGRIRGLEIVDVHPEEPFAANTLRVGPTVLMASTAARTAAQVAALGYDVRLIELSELAKAEAGLTCLSLLVD